MNNTLNRADIINKINETPNRIFSMTYVKADGSLREATGRLHVRCPQHTLVPGTGEYLGESGKDALINHGNIKYFDCGVDGNPRHGQEFGRGDYRTAKLSRIKTITINGVTYTVI